MTNIHLPRDKVLAAFDNAMKFESHNDLQRLFISKARDSIAAGFASTIEMPLIELEGIVKMASSPKT